MHVCTITSRHTGKAAGTAALTPAAYFALRRAAAGYSIDALARALLILADNRINGPRPNLDETRARYRRMRDTIMLLERPGAATGDADLLLAIASLIPFDRAVYRQLATEPAHRHPRVCRGCGCSQSDPCITEQDGMEHVCRWATHTACTRCITDAIAGAVAA
ncbi:MULTISPECIES: hypothetical protein [unclassified Sphingomonas]|uniref:hypothetical protein n=1 Tax=unclassified Sphingomonas TaxID=196159 RepID=UPI00226AE13C|nr:MULTISPECIES: hypothetical protein [unclassified Sphingomonas]